MKKLYHLMLLIGILAAIPANIQAQTSTKGKTYLGYAKYDDQIYEYDGISLNVASKVGCAIKLTREMLEPYIGGTITGMRVGWDTSMREGTYEGFVRNTFNGEDLATGTATVKYSYSSSTPGWNVMTLTNYDIPEDVEQLIVGFTTNVEKDEYAIPTLFPHDTQNSCYLWVDGDNDEQGNPRWVDRKEKGILPILLQVSDTKGTFNFIPIITHLTDNGLVLSETASDVLMRIRNAGSIGIRDFEITSRQGEQSWSETVTLSTGLAVAKTSGSFLAPVYCFHSGEVELSITKVNDNEVPNPKVHKINLISVPQEIAANYERRPQVEYYESENSYMSPRYYDSYVKTPVTRSSKKITFVCQHLDDQFMTGDDDATRLCLQLCDNDSSQVSIPAMTIDRTMATDNILFQMNGTPNPMFDVFIETTDATNAFNTAAKHPTFVSIGLEGQLLSDGETLNVSVSGEIAEGVMPTGERPLLTVYLMEKNVDSDSQLFWTEKEKEAHTGHYTHANIIREILTNTDGDVVENDGEFRLNFTTEIDTEWKMEDLYLVAFVHRNGKLGGRRMQVFNSAEGSITYPDGIEAVKDLSGKAGSVIHDLTGRKTISAKKGIYIKNGKKIVIR